MRQTQTVKPVLSLLAAIALALAVTAPFDPAFAGGGGSMPGGTCPPSNKGGGGKIITINKPVIINKNLNVTTNIDASKNINITNNIDASKNITIYKPVTIIKNIDDSKNITINKSLVINKGGSGGSATATATASASATAEASAMSLAFAQVIANSNAAAQVGFNGTYGGGGNAYSNSYADTALAGSGGGNFTGTVETEQRCTMQAASVVKSIHAVCVAGNGAEFAASHMMGETWIESGYEGEIARCLPGAHLKVTIGDVLQSDQGMAASYEKGLVLTCGAHQALRHYKDGVLKCAEAVPVPDCTERTNLRRYGTGDMFFTFRAEVCLPSQSAQTSVQGLSLNGGVGE